MARYRLKLIDIDKQNYLEKLVVRSEGYLSQLNEHFKELQKRDNKISLLIEEKKEKEDARRKNAGKVGGLSTALAKEKKKNEILIELVKHREEELSIKNKELSEINRQLDFFKNHRRAPSIEDYKNWVQNRKECSRRAK